MQCWHDASGARRDPTPTGWPSEGPRVGEVAASTPACVRGPGPLAAAPRPAGALDTGIGASRKLPVLATRLRLVCRPSGQPSGEAAGSVCWVPSRGQDPQRALGLISIVSVLCLVFVSLSSPPSTAACGGRRCQHCWDLLFLGLKADALHPDTPEGFGLQVPCSPGAVGPAARRDFSFTKQGAAPAEHAETRLTCPHHPASPSPPGLAAATRCARPGGYVAPCLAQQLLPLAACLLLGFDMSWSWPAHPRGFAAPTSTTSDAFHCPLADFRVPSGSLRAGSHQTQTWTKLPHPPWPVRHHHTPLSDHTRMRLQDLGSR